MLACALLLGGCFDISHEIHMERGHYEYLDNVYLPDRSTPPRITIRQTVTLREGAARALATGDPGGAFTYDEWCPPLDGRSASDPDLSFRTRTHRAVLRRLGVRRLDGFAPRDGVGRAGTRCVHELSARPNRLAASDGEAPLSTLVRVRRRGGRSVAGVRRRGRPRRLRVPDPAGRVAGSRRLPPAVGPGTWVRCGG